MNQNTATKKVKIIFKRSIKKMLWREHQTLSNDGKNLPAQSKSLTNEQ